MAAMVRYLVADVDRAVAFYVDHLGSSSSSRWAPAFARVGRDDLTVWLSGPELRGPADADGREPVAGRWNRFVLEVDDLASGSLPCRRPGCHSGNPFVTGPGGKQTSSRTGRQPIELSEPRRSRFPVPPFSKNYR